jgi:hypothetical protein
LGLTALVALSACTELQNLGLLKETQQNPLVNAQMMQGSVTLVPPSGYCIDRTSLNSRFALLARCDVLGDSGATAAAPLSLITVSMSSARGNTALPTPEQTAQAFGLSNVAHIQNGENRVVFRADGPAPAAELSMQHWRGTAIIDDKIMGVALYISQDTEVAASRAQDILSGLLASAQAGS